METLLTLQEAARTLAVSVKRVHALCRSGKLAYVVVGGRGERRFLPEQIQAFIEAQTVQAPKPVDTTKPRKLLCPRKGGDSKRSTGNSVRAQLRQEMREWQ